MAGVPKWEKERIQIYKSTEGFGSDDEELINQLVEADMQKTTLSMSLNPPIAAKAPPPGPIESENKKESSGSRVHKRKSTLHDSNQGNTASKRRRHIDMDQKKTCSSYCTGNANGNSEDHYPLKEQTKGAWYVIYNTPRAPPTTPPHQ